MSKTKKVRRPGYEATGEVYDLCNRKHYFTSGSNSAYEKMFELVKQGKPLNDIALAIWICSTDVEFAQIYADLEDALYVER